MPPPAALLKRLLIFLHRWSGVVLSAIFTLWFVSGIVMMYWSFPEVTTRMRLERSVTLAPDLVKVAPAAAYAALGRDEPPSGVRLSSFDGRPIYRFNGARGGSLAVFADDGSVYQAPDPAAVDRVASRWARRPLRDAEKATVTEADQWTVAGQFRSARPLIKYSFTDGQQVYVNGATAEVVQYTTTASRFWAWVGAIPHWMYYTPLRKQGQQWFSVVVYSSLIGTITAVMGLTIAVWMYSPRRRYRYAGTATAIPYKGWKRWHTIAGLVFGLVTTTWTFSGLLSMGPFAISDRITAWTVAEDDRELPDIAGALQGDAPFDLIQYAARPVGDALAMVREFAPREIEFTTFAGEPIYVATNALGQTRIIPMSGAARESLDPERVISVVREAAGPALAGIELRDGYDAYYLDRRGEAPLPVISVRLNDAASTRLYINPRTGRLVATYDSREWISRWLYHGLHSLDFPWLYAYRPLWDIVVITLLLGGTALCTTSLVLTVRLLLRKVIRAVGPHAAPANDDLAFDA
jgi:hypothetical protein